MKTLLLNLSLLFIPFYLPAQTELLSLSGQAIARCDPFATANNAFIKNSNYLGAVNALDSLKKYCLTKSEQNFYLQAALTYKTI